MHPKRLSPLSAAARMMGKKGGKRTLELHGAEHFSKASQGTESFWRWVAQKKGQGSRRAGRKPEERNNRQTWWALASGRTVHGVRYREALDTTDKREALTFASLRPSYGTWCNPVGIQLLLWGGLLAPVTTYASFFEQVAHLKSGDRFC